LKRLSIALLAFGVFACPLRGAEQAPAVRLRLMNDSPFALESLKGSVGVLDFWAPWCVPCRTSFPALDALQSKYEKQGLRVLGLTLDANDDAIIAFLNAVPVGFTILRDASGQAGEAFHVVAMPTTFVLDREGRIAARFEGGGAGVHAKLEAAVATLLAGGTLGGDAGVRVAPSARATGGVKAWQRGTLADPMMNLDGDRITQVLRDHIHASKEGAAGTGGPAGGGCGCN
jgi:cytochrome c biogenesis protein CcmG, thiol:disulfide interchange protein DsbE